MLDIIREARLLAYAVDGERWRSRGGRLTRFHDFWKQLHIVMRHLDARKADRSFAEFLDDAPGGPSAADARSLARAFVEGFHAADARRISTKALADGGSPSEDAEEQRQMRIADGYDRVPEWLARDLGDRITTESVVERIEWDRGAVELTARRTDGSSLRIPARAAIITVPLGVLLASAEEPGAITFSPNLPVLERVRSGLTMGAVVKVTVLFRERWWTDRLRAAPRDASLESMSFLHGDSDEVPVWWSLHPAHASMMIGWSGGPAAQRLAGLPADRNRGPRRQVAREQSGCVASPRVVASRGVAGPMIGSTIPSLAERTATRSWVVRTRRQSSRGRSRAPCGWRARPPTPRDEPARCTEQSGAAAERRDR